MTTATHPTQTGWSVSVTLWTIVLAIAAAIVTFAIVAAANTARFVFRPGRAAA